MSTESLDKALSCVPKVGDHIKDDAGLTWSVVEELKLQTDDPDTKPKTVFTLYLCNDGGPWHFEHHSYEDLVELLSSGGWGKVPGKWDRLAPDPDRLKDGGKKIHRARQIAVETFKEEFKGDFSEVARPTEKDVWRLIKSRGGRGRTQATEAVKRWLESGLKDASLMPAVRTYEPDAYFDQAKRGPKGGAKGLDREDEDRFIKAAEHLRSKGDTPSAVSGAYIWMIGACYEQEARQANELRAAGDLEAAEACLPSEGQFLYWWDRHASEFDRKHVRRTAMDIHNNDRQLSGDPKFECDRPMQRCEIDECDLDVTIVSSLDRHRTIGRGHVYFETEDGAGAIVGHYTTFERNSFLGASGCLLDLCDDHWETCAKAGVDMEGFFWPHHVKPRTLVVDFGSDFQSDAFTDGCTDQGINVRYAPPGTGSLKPNVERKFGDLKGFCADALAKHGLIYRDHSSKHYQEALLTLQELEEIVILPYIVKHNSQPMPDYPYTADMERRKVPHTREGVWRYLERNGGAARIDDERAFFRAFMVPCEPRPTADTWGIHWKGLDFDPTSDPKLSAACRRAGHKGARLGGMLADPRDCGHLYYVDDALELRMLDLKPTKAMKGRDKRHWEEQEADHAAQNRARHHDKLAKQAIEAKARRQLEEKVAEKAALKGPGKNTCEGMNEAYEQERLDQAYRDRMSVRLGFEPDGYEVPEDGTEDMADAIEVEAEVGPAGPKAADLAKLTRAERRRQERLAASRVRAGK